MRVTPKILDSEVWEMPLKAKMLAVTCMLLADSDGRLVTSIRALSKCASLSLQQTRTGLHILQDAGFLEVKPTQRETGIIVNKSRIYEAKRPAANTTFSGRSGGANTTEKSEKPNDDGDLHGRESAGQHNLADRANTNETPRKDNKNGDLQGREGVSQHNGAEKSQANTTFQGEINTSETPEKPNDDGDLHGRGEVSQHNFSRGNQHNGIYIYNTRLEKNNRKKKRVIRKENKKSVTGREEEILEEALFREFWEVYPPCPPSRRSRKATVARWNGLVKSGVSAAELVMAAKLYAVERDGEDEKYTAGPQFFLGPRDERWRAVLAHGRRDGDIAVKLTKKEKRNMDVINTILGECGDEDE